MSLTTENTTMSSEFTRENIEKLEKNIKIVDSDTDAGIDLFCYVHCESTDSDILKQSRGVVFHGDKLVMKGFPFTYEYTIDNNLKNIEEDILPIFDQCSFYDSYEGSLIRMFYFNNKWYLSTNKKLDAFRSKWASKESFGSFFKIALESEIENNDRLRNALNLDNTTDSISRFQDLLDKDKQYMFLLLNNTENRIVSKQPDRPTLFHVGTFVDFNLVMTEDIYIPYPKKHNFNNIDELFKYVDNVDYKNLQGVIIFTPNNSQYKIFNKDYHELYNVRGNEPSIKFRYLQVRMVKKDSDILHYLYPEFSKYFDDYENYIYEIANDIKNAYVDRFIKKNYITVPSEEYQVIKECHSWHLEDRIINKINYDKVLDILNKQPATNLNRMIKKKIGEKLGFKNDKPKPREHFSLFQKKTVIVN